MGVSQAILAIYTFAVFMLLLAILSKAAWPKISEALAEREKRIEGAIADAAAKHEEAKRLLAEHEAKLAGAAAEVRALLEEARRDAEATKTEIVAEARDGGQAGARAGACATSTRRRRGDEAPGRELGATWPSSWPAR